MTYARATKERIKKVLSDSPSSDLVEICAFANRQLKGVEPNFYYVQRCIDGKWESKVIDDYTEAEEYKSGHTTGAFILTF